MEPLEGVATLVFTFAVPSLRRGRVSRVLGDAGIGDGRTL